MKKTLSIIIALTLVLSVCMLCSCDKEKTPVDTSAVVNVSVVDEIGGTTILESATVPYSEGMTVLGASVQAFADAGVVYELTEDGSALVSINELVDFYYSTNADNNNQWIFAVNGKSTFETDDAYSAENAVAAGDTIVWTYSEAEITE